MLDDTVELRSGTSKVLELVGAWLTVLVDVGATEISVVACVAPSREAAEVGSGLKVADATEVISSPEGRTVASWVGRGKSVSEAVVLTFVELQGVKAKVSEALAVAAALVIVALEDGADVRPEDVADIVTYVEGRSVAFVVGTGKRVSTAVIEAFADSGEVNTGDSVAFAG